MSQPVPLGRSLALIAAQAVLVFGLGLGVVGARVLPDLARPYAPSPGLAALLAVLVPATVALVILGSCRAPRRSLHELGWTFSRPVRSVLLGVVGAAACLVLLVGVLLALGETPSSIVRALIAPTPGERLVLLVIGVHAAFTEETLFRGNLLAALSLRMRPTPALLLTALVFALYHLNLNPVALLPKLAFGVVFALLRRRAGNLFAPAIAHAAFWVVAGAL